MRRYVMGLWSALSQLCNVLFLLGHPNESISGRSHREGWKAKKLINAMFFWQVDHCKSAYMNDLKWARQYLEQHEANR